MFNTEHDYPYEIPRDRINAEGAPITDEEIDRALTKYYGLAPSDEENNQTG